MLPKIISKRGKLVSVVDLEPNEVRLCRKQSLISFKFFLVSFEFFFLLKQLISTANSCKQFLPPGRERKRDLSSIESGPQRFPIIYYQNRSNYRRLVNFILLLSLLRFRRIDIHLPPSPFSPRRNSCPSEVQSRGGNLVRTFQYRSNPRVACLARIIHPSNPIGTYR